jgi:hypothetical protein
MGNLIKKNPGITTTATPGQTTMSNDTQTPHEVKRTHEELIAMNGTTEPDPKEDKWYGLIRDGYDLQSEDVPEIEEIVEGILPAQAKLLIGSGSKSFKTWLTIHMALCIAAGVPFFNRETLREPVLYVNLELKPATFTRRLQAITKALGITLSKSWFQHLPLRGQLSGVPLLLLVSRLIAFVKHGGFKVVVLDPVYKLSTQGDENSVKDTTLLFNELDRLTTETGCAVILNDHFSKGNKAETDPLDAIRGSSAKGGDVDAAMILRKHEVGECFRVDMIHRELPPVEPFVIGWNFPVMELMPDLDPDNMKKPGGGRKAEHDPVKMLAAIEKHTANNPISVSAWADKAKVKRPTLQTYLPTMRANGWITTIGEGNSARQAITLKGLQQL